MGTMANTAIYYYAGKLLRVNKKVIKKVIKCSHHKDKIFFPFFSFYCMCMLAEPYSGNHFIIYVSQTIMLYALYLYSDVF